MQMIGIMGRLVFCIWILGQLSPLRINSVGAFVSVTTNPASPIASEPCSFETRILALSKHTFPFKQKILFRNQRRTCLAAGKDVDKSPFELSSRETGFEDLEDLDEETIAEIQSNRPSEFMVMKELLGVNIFTYILVAAILFFFTMNTILGPGWLGSLIGFGSSEGWNNVQSSDSLPAMLDLSSPDYLVK